MPRRRLELVRAFVLVALGALAAPAAAGAHAVITPGASRPAELQRYTLVVPTERPVPTTAVSIKVPAGIDFLLVEQTPGWKAKLEKRGGKPDVVRFTGGSIPPDFFASFHLIARNPVEQGTLLWKVDQRYEDGQSVLWAGPPSSDTSGPRTTITEQAVPSDVMDVESGTQAAGGGGAPAPAKPAAPRVTASGSSGRADVALGLAGAALLLALAGLAAAIRARRYDPAPAA
jgi:uncharacterized protein YcnI